MNLYFLGFGFEIKIDWVSFVYEKHHGIFLKLVLTHGPFFGYKGLSHLDTTTAQMCSPLLPLGEGLEGIFKIQKINAGGGGTPGNLVGGVWHTP